MTIVEASGSFQASRMQYNSGMSALLRVYGSSRSIRILDQLYGTNVSFLCGVCKTLTVLPQDLDTSRY